MNCPYAATETGTTYMQFYGNQYMAIQAPLSETSNIVRIRFRIGQVYAVPVGIYGVVGAYNPTSANGNDRELFLDRGRVCSRLYRNSSIEIICSTWRYDDGQWHVVERSYGGSNGGYHRLRVDNESVVGSFTASDFTWKTGAAVGFAANTQLFTGSIDYVMSGTAP